ncbi:MAG: acyltransferase [Vicinamibacteria bacterium]
MPVSPERPGDLPALTSLRFLAAAVVFFFHFPPAETSWPLAVVAGQGHVGVTVFFVLSGFLITVRYADALFRGSSGVALRDYFTKRVARIVPLYWTVLAFNLVLVRGTGRSFGTLPEWLLLQGFLSRSIDALAVPTSWTLTLEECFYAVAPLVFLSLRRARLPAAAVLLAWTAAFLVCGLALHAVVDPARFGFLGSLQELFRHTFFGRFADFALGVAAGRLYLSGAVGRVFARPRGNLAASALGLLGLALVFAGQAGMSLVGGLDTDRWARAWPFNLVVAAGAAVLVLGLTAPASPLTRLLALPPFVYLGRVSYALYLVQLTPLGKGLLYRLVPADTPGYGLLLYAGMTALSALLYELVEEPGRRLVLRALGRGQRPVPIAARARRAPAWAFVSVTLVVVCVQIAAWAEAHASARRGLPTIDESRQAAVSLSDRIVTVPADGLPARAVEDGVVRRVPIPDRWMIGSGEDRRAPPSLLVYADGAPIPFERRAEDVAGEPTGAHFRGPRATFVDVRTPHGDEPDRLTLVLHDPLFGAVLLAVRLGSAPELLLVVAATVLLALGTTAFAFRRWRPAFRTAASLALACGALFLLAELHALAWAPLIVMMELLAVAGTALRRPRPAA